MRHCRTRSRREVRPGHQCGAGGATTVARGRGGLSTATLAELHFGVLVARDAIARAELLRRLSVVQSMFAALPVDDTVARAYGHLAAAVVAAGRQPPARVLDLLIAATAVAHQAHLVTANARDLVGLDGLVDVVEL